MCSLGTSLGLAVLRYVLEPESAAMLTVELSMRRPQKGSLDGKIGVYESGIRPPEAW